MSVMLRMIAKNVPLCQWRAFLETGDGTGFYTGGKNDAKVVQTIFSSLSHPSAVELVAKEFELLPSHIRIQVRDLCNKGNASGNVRKGVQRLNELLKGALLREVDHRPTMSRRVEIGGKMQYQDKRVNPAVAGARRKYQVL